MTDRFSNKMRRAVVAVATLEQKLLVIQRSRFVRAPLHYCFPGGGIEPGESCAEAIIRELKEELSIDIRPIGELWTSKTLSGYELNWWRVELPESFSVMPNSAEVGWWGWCSPSEFLELKPLLPTNQEFMKAWAMKEFELSIG